jgi:hypothetical protein
MYCRTYTYEGIKQFSYQSKKKGKTLEERKEAFRMRLINAFNKDSSETKETDYPKWLRLEFLEYWLEFANDNGRKMRFELETSWYTMRRLATAKKRIYSKDPRWKTETDKTYHTKSRFKEGQMAPGINYDGFKFQNR